MYVSVTLLKLYKRDIFRTRLRKRAVNMVTALNTLYIVIVINVNVIVIIIVLFILNVVIIINVIVTIWLLPLLYTWYISRDNYMYFNYFNFKNFT